VSMVVHLVALVLGAGLMGRLFMPKMFSNHKDARGIRGVGKHLGTLLQLLPLYLPLLNAILGIIMWHIEWHTGLPFDVAEMSPLFSCGISLLAIVWLLNSQRANAALPVTLIAKNELLNLLTRALIRIFTRNKLTGIIAVVPGSFGLLCLLAAVLWFTCAKLRWGFTDKVLYGCMWCLMVSFYATEQISSFFIGGLHVLSIVFYGCVVCEILRGLFGKQQWRMVLALNLLLFFLWERAPERRLILFVVNYQYVYLLVPLGRWLSTRPSQQMHRSSPLGSTGEPVTIGKRDVSSEILGQAVAILFFNQAFHDYGQVFGYNFKPDVDPFTAVGVANFNETPVSAALMMAFSKTGVFYLSTLYTYIAHNGSHLPLLICVITAAARFT